MLRAHLGSFKAALGLGLTVIVLMSALLLANESAKNTVFEGRNDFLAIYAGGALSFTKDLYDPVAVSRVQVESGVGTEPALRFPRLPGYGMALYPLSRLPYLWAYAVWQVMNLLAVMAAVAVWPYRRSVFAVALGLCMPLYMSFVAGQDVAFLLLGISAMLRLSESNRPVWAGIAFGACLIKFHFFWLVPLVLWMHRKFLVVLGIVVSAAVLLLPAFLVNAEWPVDYYSAVVMGRDVISKTPISLFPLLGWFGLIAGFATILITARRMQVHAAVCVSIAVAVLVSPHCYFHDLVLFAPFAAVVWEDW